MRAKAESLQDGLAFDRKTWKRATKATAILQKAWYIFYLRYESILQVTPFYVEAGWLLSLENSLQQLLSLLTRFPVVNGSISTQIALWKYVYFGIKFPKLPVLNLTLKTRTYGMDFRTRRRRRNRVKPLDPRFDDPCCKHDLRMLVIAIIDHKQVNNPFYQQLSDNGI